jgi:hypothetical protein
MELNISLESLLDSYALKEEFSNSFDISKNIMGSISFTDNVKKLALPETRTRVADIQRNQILANLLTPSHFGIESKEINNFSNND